MAFEIHSPKGRVIPINELDKEAAEFWGVEIHKKYYAQPPLDGYYRSNWFDTIGWSIHHPENYTQGWDDVKCTLWVIQAKDLHKFICPPIDRATVAHKLMSEKITHIQAFLRPYFDLIDHWESKGYIPITLKD